MNTCHLPKEHENNLWYRYTDGDAVLIFVHGILSDSRSCWLCNDEQTNQPICYWPELIKSDARYEDVGIYLAGYHTAVDDFSIQQCARQVYAFLSEPDHLGHAPVLKKSKITFVCHSMGGVVARYLLCERPDAFKDKRVGIVLIASPSYGTNVTRSLDRVIYVYNQKQLGQLEWGSEFLKDLDQRFKNMMESRQIPNLFGREFFENRFVIHSKWAPFFARTKVVTEESAARHFGFAQQVGGSDHVTICKPKSVTDPVHQYLFVFLKEKDLLPTQKRFTTDPTPEPNSFELTDHVQKCLMLLTQINDANAHIIARGRSGSDPWTKMLTDTYNHVCDTCYGRRLGTEPADPYFDAICREPDVTTVCEKKWKLGEALDDYRTRLNSVSPVPSEHDELELLIRRSVTQPNCTPRELETAVSQAMESAKRIR
jgi:pimeloyl-ACP methyl ester carboxylesterase